MTLLRLILVSLLCNPLVAQSAKWSHDNGLTLPDHKVSPGATNPQIIADISGKSHKVSVRGVEVEGNLCSRSFRTCPFRAAITQSEKKKACAAYGAQACPGPDWELDHLISLEIGGSDDITNLWPEPIGEARIKDHRVEDVLPKLICSGKISLPDAQRCIASDWVACSKTITSLEEK